MEKEIEKSIEAMAARWSSSIVCRKAIREFTGGTVSEKTLANEDSKGTGPSGKFLLMNQVVYPLESLTDWLKSRAASSWKTRKEVH
jgi:hypothetical protein